MNFKETVLQIIKESSGNLTPQEIRGFIKADYPELYKTESHLRNVEKGHYKDEDHALLAQIYTTVTQDPTFSIDRSTKPYKVGIAGDPSQLVDTKLYSEQDVVFDLFNKYKENPDEEWLKDYRERLRQVESLRGGPSSLITESVLRQLWFEKSNGIASVGQGFMYESEFEALKAELPELTLKIINAPSSSTLDEVEMWAQQKKASGELKRITWAVIFRVFAASNPDELSTIVNRYFQEQLIKVLNEKYGFSISLKGNWFDNNKDLMEALRNHGLEYEDRDTLNTFAWMLYEWLVLENPEAKGNITRQDVFDAIAEIDDRGVNSNERSSTYDLIQDAKRYPPKLVYSLAHKYRNGSELKRSTFEGGENEKCFEDLRALGFAIERKDYVSKLLSKFVKQARQGINQKYGGYTGEFCGLSVKASFGQGNFASVPWISFTGYGQTTSEGIYPVYLYYRSIDVLILTYGISETKKPAHDWNNIADKTTVGDYLLKNHNHKAEHYGRSYVHSVYESPFDFTDLSYTEGLDSLIDEFHKLMSPTPPGPKEPTPPVKPILSPSEIADSFSASLLASHVNFGLHHHQRVKAFVSSLMTKPLVILTGLSGSGKTQIAIRFGEWLGKERMLVAPVRPDWTGAEALFGYEDALKPVLGGRASWAVPDTLRFFLRAASDPDYPYLLVLDEMNLAHVERYFADVLSGMESDQPCLPNLKQEEDGCWRIPVNGAEKIKLPNNVFVVGTVNVDETTYMFSPKVLDRANTFEFRVTADDFIEDYVKPSECESGESGLIRGFLEIGRDHEWHRQNGFVDLNDLSNQLRHIHSLLAIQGFEFGHRVFYESQRFAAIYAQAGETDISRILDLVVMQKLLPRLHGSRRRLEGLLRTFAEFCFSNNIESETGSSMSTFEPEDQDAGQAMLPNSFDKLKRMLRSLRANQFTSFTE